MQCQHPTQRYKHMHRYKVWKADAPLIIRWLLTAYIQLYAKEVHLWTWLDYHVVPEMCFRFCKKLQKRELFQIKLLYCMQYQLQSQADHKLYRKASGMDEYKCSQEKLTIKANCIKFASQGCCWKLFWLNWTTFNFPIERLGQVKEWWMTLQNSLTLFWSALLNRSKSLQVFKLLIFIWYFYKKKVSKHVVTSRSTKSLAVDEAINFRLTV